MIGALAQLGERLLCTQEVSGSIPLGSTFINVFFENWIGEINQVNRESLIFGFKPFMVKLERAHGGCLGTRSR